MYMKLVNVMYLWFTHTLWKHDAFFLSVIFCFYCGINAICREFATFFVLVRSRVRSCDECLTLTYTCIHEDNPCTSLVFSAVFRHILFNYTQHIQLGMLRSLQQPQDHWREILSTLHYHLYMVYWIDMREHVLCMINFLIKTGYRHIRWCCKGFNILV